MEGKTRKVERRLKIERGFECSRLEREVLAASYERALPPISVVVSGGGRRVSPGSVRSSASTKRVTDSERQIAIGGL
jgi:hypothetical protein